MKIEEVNVNGEIFRFRSEQISPREAAYGDEEILGIFPPRQNGWMDSSEILTETNPSYGPSIHHKKKFPTTPLNFYTRK